MSADAPLPPTLFSHLSRLLPEPLLLVSMEGALMGSNASARTLLGRQAAELHGQPLGALSAEAPEQLTGCLRTVIDTRRGGVRQLVRTTRTADADMSR